MFPVSSRSTRETIALKSSGAAPQLRGTNHMHGTVYYVGIMNPQSVFALQQIILLISGIFKERFKCGTNY